MPSEENLERHINKLMISKIFKVDSKFSEDCAENFLRDAYIKNSYIERIDDENRKYWRGFTSKYVYSFKTKTKNINDEIIQTKDFYEGIDELYENEVFISKIFKNTYVIKKDAISNPSFVDTIILPDLNFICIIGSKENVQVPEETLKDFLNENEIHYEEINICHDFLLWLLWKLYLGENISSDISLDYFEDLRVGLDNPRNIAYDNSPTSIKTEGTGHEMPSLPICYGLFNKKPLNQLKGEFIYKGKKFILKIDIFKRNETEISNIHIHSNGDLEGLYYSEKLQLILPFLYNLSNLIYEWENFENKDKYPDEEYLDTLLENAKDEFNETIEAFEEYKENYLSKIQ